MLYLNLLQLSFWFGLFYSSLPLPRTLGASLLDLSLNATPIDGPDRPPDLTVCVDDTHHPTWGLPPDGFDLSTCRQAVELIATRIEDKLYTSYEFYSRQVYPHGPMNPSSDAWPLAQGASAVECALVIRMTRDFASDALPISNGRFAPTRQAKPIQTNSWRFILRAIENLLATCVQNRGLPGWSMDTKNIVVAFWPRTSVINDKYGIRIGSPQPNTTDTSWLVLSSK